MQRKCPETLHWCHFPDNQQLKKTVGEEMLFMLQVSINKIKGPGIREGIKELLMTKRTESY